MVLTRFESSFINIYKDLCLPLAFLSCFLTQRLVLQLSVSLSPVSALVQEPFFRTLVQESYFRTLVQNLSPEPQSQNQDHNSRIQNLLPRPLVSSPSCAPWT